MLLRSCGDYIRSRLGTSCPTGLPDHYCVLDVEGTGFRQEDLVVEIAHCLVIDRKPVSQGSLYLDWTQLGVPAAWIDSRLTRVREQIEFDEAGRRTGFRFPLTADYLRQHGRSPQSVLEFYAHFINELRSWRCPIAGHSVLYFDFPKLQAAYSQALAVEDFSAGPDEVVDCGLIELGNELHTCLDCLKPKCFAGEPLANFWSRLRGAATRARWSMSYCLEKYGLLDRVIPRDAIHRAGMDCYAEHLVLEQQREAALNDRSRY